MGTASQFDVLLVKPNGSREPLSRRRTLTGALGDVERVLTDPARLAGISRIELVRTTKKWGAPFATVDVGEARRQAMGGLK